MQLTKIPFAGITPSTVHSAVGQAWKSHVSVYPVSALQHSLMMDSILLRVQAPGTGRSKNVSTLGLVWRVSVNVNVTSTRDTYNSEGSPLDHILRSGCKKAEGNQYS
jgi:hypothetical protein